MAEFPGVEVLSALQAHWENEPTRYVRLNLVLAIGKPDAGEVAVDGHSGDLTVTLRDGHGASLWSKKLSPDGDR